MGKHLNMFKPSAAPEASKDVGRLTINSLGLPLSCSSHGNSGFSRAFIAMIDSSPSVSHRVYNLLWEAL